MGQKVFTLILVVVLGVLVGVGVISKQKKELNSKAMLETILTQQQSMINAQNRIEQKLAISQVGGSQPVSIGSSSGLTIKVQKLEQRIATLENQLKGVQDFLKQAKAAVAGQQKRNLPPPEDFTKVYQIPVEHSSIYGNADAPITIVEFLDFQCPFCARFHEPMMEAVKAYPKKVKYILKNFPLSFHQYAKPAAKAAFAAREQGKYWEMVEALLSNGRDLSEEKIQEIAKQLKLDMKKFMKDYRKDDEKWESLIQKDVQLGIKVEVRGTPTFYINGRKTRARDVATWKAEIEKALKEKK